MLLYLRLICEYYTRNVQFVLHKFLLLVEFIADFKVKSNTNMTCKAGKSKYNSL